MRSIPLFYFILFLFPIFSSAQFYKGFGVMGGLTLSSQKWIETKYTSVIDETVTDKIKHKLLWGWNAELFAEFINRDHIRWRTEFEYDKKGTKHRDTKDKNKLNYISWNNFLIFRGEVFAGHPYFLIGPRVEYTFKQNTPSVPYDFNPIHFSWSAGIGFEWLTYGNIKPLVELHYNPDFTYALDQDNPFIGYENLGIRNRAWELRVGIVIRGRNTGCPPVLK